MPKGPDFMTRDQIGTPSMTLMIGLSRTGKSTWVNDFVSLNPESVVISQDDMRRALGHEWIAHLNPLVKAMSVAAAHAQLIRGSHIIIDDTNLTRKGRKLWFNLARLMNAKIKVVEVKVPRDYAIHRIQCKADNFSWYIVEQQYDDYSMFDANYEIEDDQQYSYHLVDNVIDTINIV